MCENFRLEASIGVPYLLHGVGFSQKLKTFMHWNIQLTFRSTKWTCCSCVWSHMLLFFLLHYSNCNVINPYFSQFCVIIKLHHLPMLSFKICHECFPAWSTSHFYLLQYLPQSKCHAFFSLQVIFLKGCKVYRVNNKQRYICQLTETFIFKYFDAICSFSHVQ